MLPDADPTIREALREGGVLGGASALRSYGIWVTHPTRLQVATPPHAGRPASTPVERLWVPLPCLLRGWKVETQAPAPGGGRSDLLIDGWLNVEADGRAWHDDPQQAAKDRRRNSAITAAGRRWLRFGYADVVHEIEKTLGVIEAVLASGRPRRWAG